MEGGDDRSLIASLIVNICLLGRSVFSGPQLLHQTANSPAGSLAQGCLRKQEAGGRKSGPERGK